ncbi:hypothetical protein RHMOL_Rhmol13G0141700 [Rhododendron molle]|uniref:Uncharacterized protein n=1 Tax=Rhododendron molle TaxID=49168 RepID=A0ACC0L6I4_RHOML|nr:hypothetical protein RHMOL_Rhmol13G0141700 [Rhododendron molle]
MAPNVIPLKDITLTSKNFTVQAMVVEKNIPRMSSSGTSLYQRIVLKDKEKNRMQATVFGYNIRVFESSLKLYHTYSITNLGVGATPELFCFLENKNQLRINACTPVEEIETDGLTMRTMKYNFTPIVDLQQIKEANPKLGCTLATRNSSSFIFDIVLPEATALQSWAIANAAKLRELAAREPKHLLIPKKAEDPEDDIIKIANLPISVDKTQYLNVQGIARVTDFSQNFYYLACSICKKATNAYADEDFWCNYCAQKVPALTKYTTFPMPPCISSFLTTQLKKNSLIYRLKFNIQVTDPTGTIQATVFSEVASEFYNITAVDVINGKLALPTLHMLAEPKECIITLKANMHSYAGISQLKFTAHSINIDNRAEGANRSETLLALLPTTPNKRSKKMAQRLEHINVQPSRRQPSRNQPSKILLAN